MDTVRESVEWLTDPIHIAESVNFIRTMELVGYNCILS